MPSGLIAGQTTQPSDIAKHVPPDNNPSASLHQQGRRHCTERGESTARSYSAVDRLSVFSCVRSQGHPPESDVGELRELIAESLPFSRQVGPLRRQLLFVMATAVLVNKILVSREALIPRALAGPRRWLPGHLERERVC